MIDTHSHLYDKVFDVDRAEVMARAKAVGVEKIFLPNEDETTIEAVLHVCEEYPGYCYPMLGFHPECVDARFRERLLPMKTFLSSHSFIAIGEVGMDLYWDQIFRKEQQEALDIQVQWAMEYDLPVMIHCRKAYPELFEVLSPYQKQLTGVFHCFEGTEKEAEALLEYEGFMLGVNGIVTFKKSTLPQVLPSVVPLGRIVMETDSPYLAPVPFRGKRNESSYVRQVAMKLSEIYQCDLSEIDAVTTKNAIKVFKRLP